MGIEVCRVYNENEQNVSVTVEPWGTRYLVPNNHFLSIQADEPSGSRVDVSMSNNGGLSVYLNDCVFDDLATEIQRSLL